MQKSRNNLIKSIQKSANKTLSEKKRFYFNRGIEFVVKSPLPKELDIEKVMGLLRANLPESCYVGIKNVYIGKFDKLQKRNLTALHYNDNIYVDSSVKSEKDLIDDLVHEFAHRYEENNAEMIYQDGLIVNEFIGKRNRLFDLLSQYIQSEKINYFDFINTEYDKEFDDFLFKEVGYEKIRNLAPTLFVRPYAATSVREYFATGFENYFLTGGTSLKNISPILHKKISMIDKSEDFKPTGG